VDDDGRISRHDSAWDQTWEQVRDQVAWPTVSVVVSSHTLPWSFLPPSVRRWSGRIQSRT